MPMTTHSSASRPLTASSLPICGPTNSTRCSRAACGGCAFSASMTCALCRAEDSPGVNGRRINTSLEVPKVCTCASRKPSAFSVARMGSSCAGCGYWTSSTVPPVNSMDRCSPRLSRKKMAAMNVSVEMMLNISARCMNGISFLKRKNSMIDLKRTHEQKHSAIVGKSVTGTPDLANLQRFQAAAAAMPEVDQTARKKDRSEHRGQNTDTVDDREAAHRTRAKRQQRQTGNQRGDVGIKDRCPGVFKAKRDGGMGRRARAQFFTDPFVDQDIRVNRHAERQRDGGDAGQCERCLQHGQDRHQQQQVQRKRED